MKKVGGLFACSALALMAFAALPLSAAELTHRWSFNGDWSDSVGRADAAGCGTYVSLYGNRVHMGYGSCTRGTGYVDLGTNMLDTTSATIEIWARHDGVESWSRVFDYGGVTTLEIAKDELPPGESLTFAVRPLTSLGTSGRPIATAFKV